MITNKDNLTLIFVHACGVGNWMWYKQKDYFSNFSCMFIELPEHGNNYNIQPFSVKSAIKMINKAVRSAPGEVILIGHEMGARLILNYLVEYTNDKVKKIVLSSTMIKTVKEGLFHKILPSKIIEKEFEKKNKNLQNIDFIKKTLDYYGVEEKYKEYYLNDMTRYKPRQLIKIIQEGLLKKLPLNLFIDNDIPALILVGEKETNANRLSAKLLSEYFSNSELIIVDNSTDNHIRTNSMVFNDRVKNFILT
ncbi:mutanobactin A biosynthesis alpha/beta hydrolase MubM [Streptococcus mutans]|nr:mutanobactin A biosynthesis alpha/beta hydrolase MubM [Streptococcus mutans]MCB5084509.1 mutanobactin A biosynthesis alpha/beta hydrolase MubM [Streptococcus mutans]